VVGNRESERPDISTSFVLVLSLRIQGHMLREVISSRTVANCGVMVMFANLDFAATCEIDVDIRNSLVRRRGQFNMPSNSGARAVGPRLVKDDIESHCSCVAKDLWEAVL
jgi:hypothetical protein